MYSLPTAKYWSLATKIQKQFQSQYSGTKMAWDGRTGIRFTAQQYTCTIVDTFPNGIRFAIDGIPDKTFYESYETLTKFQAVYL